MGDITDLLQAARGGDQRALGEAFTITYNELRDLARSRLRKSQSGGGLETTALVHECYLRLTNVGRLCLDDRVHFLGYAARVMRSVVIDFARGHLAERRGGGAELVTVHTGIPDHEAANATDLLRIEEALEVLGRTDQRLVSVVEMKYFAGFSIDEIAQTLGIAERTVRRDWDRARLLLMAVLEA